MGPGEGVRIANFLCPGNYAVSGGIKGCEIVESIAKPEFKVLIFLLLSAGRLTSYPAILWWSEKTEANPAFSTMFGNSWDVVEALLYMSLLRDCRWQPRQRSCCGVYNRRA